MEGNVRHIYGCIFTHYSSHVQRKCFPIELPCPSSGAPTSGKSGKDFLVLTPLKSSPIKGINNL